MQYEHVELQPIEICTQAWKRRSRCIGSVAANLRSSPVPHTPRCDAEAAGAEPLAEMRDRAGPEGDVDVGVEREEPLALRLGVTAADGDDHLRALTLARSRLSHVRGELRVRLLPDRAGVEDDDVGLALRRRLAQPDVLQHPFDALGIVRVHLAAERGHEVLPHRLSVPGCPAAADGEDCRRERLALRPRSLRARAAERLARQAALIGPVTRALLVEAGIGPGMRVLDVGTGRGDVALIAAEHVGEEGSVVGIDLAPSAAGRA